MATLEYNCEALLMAVVAPKQATGQPLAGIASRHHEASGDATLDTLIFKGRKGGEQLDGLQCSDVAVEITYGSQTATPTQADDRAAAVVAAVYGTPPDLSSFHALEFARIEPGGEVARQDEPKIRKRIITIPMLAKIGTPVFTP